jgi:nitrogen regulatory protein P-II 1
MKEIKAIVRPGRLDRIREAVRKLPGFPGMSVSQVDGCSRFPAGQNPRTIREALTDYSSKAKIEIVCADAMVEPIVRLIAEHAYTGQTGDGLIWVTEVDNRVRIVEKDRDFALWQAGKPG